MTIDTTILDRQIEELRLRIWALECSHDGALPPLHDSLWREMAVLMARRNMLGAAT